MGEGFFLLVPAVKAPRWHSHCGLVSSSLVYHQFARQWGSRTRPSLRSMGSPGLVTRLAPGLALLWICLWPLSTIREKVKQWMPLDSHHLCLTSFTIGLNLPAPSPRGICQGPCSLGVNPHNGISEPKGANATLPRMWKMNSKVILQPLLTHLTLKQHSSSSTFCVSSFLVLGWIQDLSSHYHPQLSIYIYHQLITFFLPILNFTVLHAPALS